MAQRVHRNLADYRIVVRRIIILGWIAVRRNARFFVARARSGIRRRRARCDCEGAREKKANDRNKLSECWARLHRVLYRRANRILQPSEYQFTEVTQESATAKEGSVPARHTGPKDRCEAPQKTRTQSEAARGRPASGVKRFVRWNCGSVG